MSVQQCNCFSHRRRNANDLDSKGRASSTTCSANVRVCRHLNHRLLWRQLFFVVFLIFISGGLFGHSSAELQQILYNRKSYKKNNERNLEVEQYDHFLRTTFDGGIANSGNMFGKFL